MPLFVDDEDYEHYIRLLAATVARCRWILLSFCLMPNHVHLLIELREPNLGNGMHLLHRAYARRFNDRHGRRGRLFEHRYSARLVKDELYFATVLGYIEQNPVQAALAGAPEEWPWSSRAIAARGLGGQWLADNDLAARRRALTET